MEKTIKYQLLNISALEYRISDKENGFSIPLDACEINLTISFNFNLDVEQVVFHYIVQYNDKRNQEELMYFQCKTVYRVIELNTVFYLHDNIVNVPDSFLLTAISIGIGAIRGMLALKNKGTYLQDIHLPIYDPVSILEGLKQYKSNEGLQANA